MPCTTRATPRRRSSCLVVCLVALTALPAAAEVRLPAGDGVAVDGKLVNELQIKKSSATSDGEKASTTLRANTIERTRVGGNLTNRTTIDELTLRAEGRGATSTMAIGTISGVTTGGDLTNTVTLGTSTNVAIGAGARACTELGTLGRVGICD